MSLSLTWTCQRNKVSFLVKFRLNKIILFNKIIILFKYYADMENYENFRSFDYIYIYIYIMVS